MRTVFGLYLAAVVVLGLTLTSSGLVLHLRWLQGVPPDDQWHIGAVLLGSAWLVLPFVRDAFKAARSMARRAG